MIFVTVPNRLFPVEHHTAIPLLHFFESTFQFACKLTGNSEWARTENLILMSKERLLATLPKGLRCTISYTGLKLWAFSYNRLVFAHS